VAVDASQRQQHVQQQQQEHVQYPASPQQQQQQQQLSLCSRLISLDLQALELPQRLLLEAVLLGLRGLRCLRLHASMESILEVSSWPRCGFGSCTT
jgi:hypothetical protein